MSGKPRAYIPPHMKSNGGWKQSTSRHHSRKFYSLQEFREKLPIAQFRNDILKSIHSNQIVILQGETGCGKSTQIPQYLVEAGYTANGMRIGCTQPRRVAAVSIARRVAEEMDVTLGYEVGYQIRFDDKTSAGTFLTYLTDGRLVTEAVHDPKMSRYSVVILDEAHERTVSTDILFSLMKRALTRRKDLKLIVMSATLDTHKFQKYFNDAPLFQVPGKMYPVQILYTPQSVCNCLSACIDTVVQIHTLEKVGDILLFLSGEEEITKVCAAIEKKLQKYSEDIDEEEISEAIVLPLYSLLPPSQQEEIFKPAPKPRYPGGKPGRKIIVATNIAETSLTINGIVYVVDSGLSKQIGYHPRIRTESLTQTNISKASANQRAGRAGRTQPGKCYRMYTEETYEKKFPATTTPEILRSNLRSLVLQLTMLGVEDLIHFDFIDHPAPETITRALEELNYIGAIDNDGKITDLGSQMVNFPMDPYLSKFVIEAVKYNCSREAVSIAALLSVPSIFLKPLGHEKQLQAALAHSQFHHPFGDHLTLLNVYHAWLSKYKTEPDWSHRNFLNERNLRTADNIRIQLSRLMSRLKLPLTSTDFESPHYYSNIRKALTAGFFMQVAVHQRKNEYITMKDNLVVSQGISTIEKDCPEWILFDRVLRLDGRIVTTTLTQISPSWLFDVAPSYFDLRTFPDGRVRDALETVLKRKELGREDGESDEESESGESMERERDE
ncbi:putative Pre-mRNA-splicing factor ATP-dependent RNA helicase ddx-15 [Blattamonas nauphoetae]|uniref:RNA helicase n=1 Tax=Blattamonas nauphoetae TaxID=2049346 RepID=A0ABQ9YAC8_9EUKA|nr:putative Pre-mRNA-splicing factor ATP-dependent RNA helicase ddx-15 [Blattamonas nauphoetae]